jgi:hypothetical protein
MFRLSYVNGCREIELTCDATHINNSNESSKYYQCSFVCMLHCVACVSTMCLCCVYRSGAAAAACTATTAIVYCTVEHQ